MEHKGYNNSISGRKHTYGFNGIELTEDLGLDLYEMPLRQYDPAIARWTTIDPITHYSQSTYTGFDNNPVYWADPSGAAVEQIAGGTKYTGEDAKVAFLTFRNQQSSKSKPNDIITINSKTKEAMITSDDNDFDTVMTDGVLSYSPKGRTRSRLESEGYNISQLEGVGMGAVDGAALLLAGEAAFAWAFRGMRAAWAAWIARSGINSGVKMTAQVTDDIIGGAFKYGDGKVTEFLANNIIKGDRLELTNMAFYPKGFVGNELKNAFGGKAMLGTFEAIKNYAKDLGFKELRIHFIRAANSSSAKPGKVFDQIFKL